jgi:rhodanese-related sulfurtransferase
MITTDRPALQNFHIEGVKHILPADALEAIQIGEAILLDVREENEYQIETIDLEDILYIPMSGITVKLNQIPNGKPIIVLCQGGVRSAKVAKFLSMNGFEDVASLDGGLIMWKALELPLGNHSK